MKATNNANDNSDKPETKSSKPNLEDSSADGDENMSQSIFVEQPSDENEDKEDANAFTGSQENDFEVLLQRMNSPDGKQKIGASKQWRR